jgi:hypothetical protein
MAVAVVGRSSLIHLTLLDPCLQGFRQWGTSVRPYVVPTFLSLYSQWMDFNHPKPSQCKAICRLQQLYISLHVRVE